MTPTRAQITKASRLSIFVGIPDDGWRKTLDARRADGASIIYVVRKEDRSAFSCPYPDMAIEWVDDVQLKSALFPMVAEWMGCMIDGADDAVTMRFAGILKELWDLHAFDDSSAKTLAQDNEPLANTIRNGRWIEDGYPLRRLKDDLKGRPAVIIAAGPSLDKQWGELLRLRMIAQPAPVAFFVVGRTYKQAMANGVGPDFVVEAEQYQASDALWEFAPLPPPGCMLACPVTVAPRVLRGWPNGWERTVMVDHTLGGSVLKLKQGEDTIDGGNSVAHMAFNLAAWMGANPICLAGVDFGYPDGARYGTETHARGTIHQGWSSEVIRIEKTHQLGASIPANDGGMIDSSPAYVNFRTYMELQIAKAKKANPELRVYTFSPRGAVIAGAPYMPITEFLCPPPSTPPSEEPPPGTSSCPSPLPPSSPDTSQAITLPLPAPESTSETPQPK